MLAKNIRPNSLRALENDDDEAIQRLIEEDKAVEFDAG